MQWFKHRFKYIISTLRMCSHDEAESRQGLHPIGVPLLLLGALIAGGTVWPHSSLAVTGRAPVSLALIINRVTGGSTLDLPPLNQRPFIYSELELDGERLRTGTVETPQIGASIYPDWAIYVDKEAIWLERGHSIDAAIRIFDEDVADADDKVLLTALAFDPIACKVKIGETDVEGDRQGSYCSVTISELQGENGTAKVTLTADW